MQKPYSKTVLLIDDDPYILQIVQTSLEVFSEWKPAIANSAKKGLEAIFRAKPDAILLDMMMPNIDGFTFLKYLQADPQLAGIPVVLLTSRVDLLETKKIMLLGVKGAIAKPFYAITLASQISQILGW